MRGHFCEAVREKRKKAAIVTTENAKDNLVPSPITAATGMATTTTITTPPSPRS